jgi:alkanesulfonate monooxygenase SsuD/methylene tetrahydromethanopterin reductase-like flavin-dependent oxidoreductase (luciferase family)
MKLGVLVEAEEGLDWDRWRKTFALAERLDFESIWISDHLQSPWDARRRGLEAWSALAVCAAETRTIVLGPLVSPITLREPAIVAHMAASLADLSSERLVVGLGIGWNADEHAAAGIAFPSVAARSRRLADGVERIRRDLGEQRIPILIGGKGQRMTLPVVARYADEWNMTPASVAEYRACSAELDRLCREIGRDPREIRRSAALGFLIGRDATELRDACARMGRLVPPLAAASDPLMAARQMGWAVGTPDEMIASLDALRTAGVERAILGHYDLDQPAALELIAERVLPALA